MFAFSNVTAPGWPGCGMTDDMTLVTTMGPAAGPVGVAVDPDIADVVGVSGMLVAGSMLPLRWAMRPLGLCRLSFCAL